MGIQVNGQHWFLSPKGFFFFFLKDICLIVFVFGSVFKNTGELHVVEVALFIDRRFSEELVDLFVCEPITHSGQQLPQIVLRNEACEE